MRFALLGDDPELHALAAAAAGLRPELIWVGEADAEGPLRDLAPNARWGDSWELLLNLPRLDGVLVGRATDAEEARAEMLRKLIQAGVPLLVVHPVVRSMLLYYEFDMIRREARGALRHYFPGRRSVSLARLADLVRGDDPRLGAVEQVLCERTMLDRTPPRVLEQLTRDAELLTVLAGPPERLTALGASDDPSVYPHLGVQLSAPSGIALRWSVGPVDDLPRGRITIIGASGKALLHMPDQGDWTLEVYRGGERIEQSSLAENAAETALTQFTDAITHGESGDDWAAACLSVELADAAVRSLKKQRTVVLHREEYSEAATFKGTMTSVGCGLILAVMGVMLLAGFLGDVLGLPAGIIRLWPIALLIVLSLFLLLQLLPGIVFGARPPRNDA